MKWPWGRRRSAEMVAEEVEAVDVAPSIQTHRSPGLEEVLQRLPEPGSCRVLDLGPAVAANVEFLGSLASRVQILDAFSRNRAGGRPAAVDSDRAVQALWDLLPSAAGSFHLVLTWDLFNYFPENRLASIVELLAEISHEEARLHAIIAASDTMPSYPNRYQIVDGSKLIYEATTTEIQGVRQMPPSEVEKTLDHFRIEHSFLLRHGVREYVAIRKK